jgi:hypothetical protein
LSLRECSRFGFRLAALASAFALALVAGAARADHWTIAARGGDVFYFPMIGDAPRIERYELATGSWLAPLPLPSQLQASDIAVSDDGIYVVGGGILLRLDLQGVLVWIVSSQARELAVDPAGLVFALGDPEAWLRAFDADDGAVRGTSSVGQSFHGLSIAPGRRRLYASDRSDEDRIAAVPYTAMGTFANPVYGPRSGNLVSDQQQTYVFPGESLVANGAGAVLDADTLAWKSSLLGPADKLVFHGSEPIRLNGYQLYRHGASRFERIGEYAFSFSQALFADGEQLISFENSSAHVAFVDFLPVSWITYGPLYYPVDPESIATGFAGAVLDGDGTLSIAGSWVSQVSRWSIPEERWLQGVSLREVPNAIVPCPALDGVLLPRFGEVRLLRRGATATEYWRSLPGHAEGVACTDRFVVTASSVFTYPGGGRLATWDADGEPIDELTIAGGPTSMAWSERHGRVYVVERGVYPSERLSSYTIDEDGELALDEETPYGLYGPIVATEGEDWLVAAGGQTFDPETLATGPYLGNLQAAAWIGDALVTLESETLRFRTPDLLGGLDIHFPGAMALLPWDDDSLAVVRTQQGFPTVRLVRLDDPDGDGRANAEDEFPADPDEWNDADDDGTGDNADAFPDDPAVSADDDGDGYGNNFDRFDHDPTEWSDADFDGHGDNGDEFPFDYTEWRDSDGDGHGDNGDWKPGDPAEWEDTDGDGTGDNADEFPLDPLEQRDYDGDQIGDHGDPFPIGDPALGLVELRGRERATFSRLGFVQRDLPGGNLGLLANGTFSLCDPQTGCLFGVSRTADATGRRFELAEDPDFIPELVPLLEDALESSLSRGFRRDVTLELVPRPDDTRILVKLDRKGARGVFKAKWVFDATLGNVPGPYRKLRFALTWKFKPAEVVRP